MKFQEDIYRDWVANRMSRKMIFLVLITLLISGCYSETNNNNTTKTEELFIATTTTIRDSGLLDFILKDFESDYNVELKVIVVGTGKALQLGRDGEVDLVLTHAPMLEEAFVEAGYADQRYEVMFNDFVIVGPESGAFDKGVCDGFSDEENILFTFAEIYESSLPFISRGDQSGTHVMEQALWDMSGYDPSQKDNYLLTGSGMGDVLTMANELQAYTLTDRGTFYKYNDQMTLKILFKAPEVMKNQYSVMIVKNDNKDHLTQAEQFVTWLLSDETQQLIGEYGVEAYGQALFIPNARK